MFPSLIHKQGRGLAQRFRPSLCHGLYTTHHNVFSLGIYRLNTKGKNRLLPYLKTNKSLSVLSKWWINVVLPLKYFVIYITTKSFPTWIKNKNLCWFIIWTDLNKQINYSQYKIHFNFYGTSCIELQNMGTKLEKNALLFFSLLTGHSTSIILLKE